MCFVCLWLEKVRVVFHSFHCVAISFSVKLETIPNYSIKHFLSIHENLIKQKKITYLPNLVKFHTFRFLEPELSEKKVWQSAVHRVSRTMYETDDDITGNSRNPPWVPIGWDAVRLCIKLMAETCRNQN